MGKRVHVRDLKKGMYVIDLDCPWTETSFLFQGLELQTDGELHELRRVCEYVYVYDPTDVGDASRVRPRAIVEADVPQAATPHGEDRQAEVLAASQAVRRGPSIHGEPIALETEMPAAQAIETDARTLVYTMLDDARLGRNVDMAGLRRVISGMVDSVVRNPDALVWFTHLRDKDQYTALHSIRVAILALAFGRHLDLSVPELNILGIGALLHDIGKVKIPNDILNKPERLTDREFEIVKGHVPEGVKILESARDFPMAAIEVAAGHHERYQGGGYARGLSGERIGLFGLMAAIVDSYDAITSDRAYHAGISPYEALGKFYAMRNKEYHGGLVDQFIQCLGTYPIGSIVEMSTGDVGVVIAVDRKHFLRPTVALARRADGTRIAPGTVLDLAAGSDRPARDREIRRVLPAKAHGIDPADYIPGRPQLKANLA
ncbi:MAG: HD-GYP domain-containing protein [Acidiferrobacter sp.]